MFSKSKKIAIKKYLNFIKEAKDCVINFETGMQDSRIIGDEAFVEKQVLKREGYVPAIELAQIIKAACLALNLQKNKLYEKTRNRQVTFARSVIGYLNKHYYRKSTMQNVANEFEIDISTLSRAITNLENKIDEPLILKMIKKIKADLRMQ